MEIYRGYDLERKPEGWTVSLNGELLKSGLSLDEAYAWVDREKRAGK